MPDTTPTLKPQTGQPFVALSAKVKTTQVAPKPGFKTTEFWMSVAVVLFALLGGSGAIGPDSELYQAINLIVGAFAAAGYGYSRAKVKAHADPVAFPDATPRPLPPLESAPSHGAAEPPRSEPSTNAAD